MRITGVEAIPLRVPGWAGDTFDGSFDDVVIRVSTDAGLEGVAEVDSVPHVVRAIVEAPRSHSHAWGLREVLVGQDPMDEDLWERMYDATSYHGRRGAVIHAISGLDIALWDIRGKARGKPVAELLGTPRRRRLMAYGTVYPMGDSEDSVRRIIDRGLGLGLRAIKLVADPFWRDDRALAERLVRAARAHVGPGFPLMIDCATAWRVAEDGLWLVPVLAECGFGWIEAPLPVDDLDGHARFQGFGVPVAGGDLGLTTRWEYQALFDVGRCDIAQPDVTMCGGLTELLRIEALALARGKRVVTHGYKTGITIAANLAFLARSPNEEMLEYSTSLSPIRWGLTRERFPIEDGFVAVPDAPGLGVTLDEEVVARFRA